MFVDGLKSYSASGLREGSGLMKHNDIETKCKLFGDKRNTLGPKLRVNNRLIF